MAAPSFSSTHDPTKKDAGSFAALASKIEEFCARTPESDVFRAKIIGSLRALEDAYRLFGVSRVITSFNGGKEATVILYLMGVALFRELRRTNKVEKSLQRGHVVRYGSSTSKPEHSNQPQQPEHVVERRLQRGAGSDLSSESIHSERNCVRESVDLGSLSDCGYEGDVGSTLPSAADTPAGEGAICSGGSRGGGKSVTPRGVPLVEAVYFRHKEEFPEILHFIDLCESRHSMRMERFDCSWEDGIAERVGDQLCCFVIGSRREDPNAGKDAEKFEPSSAWIKTCSFLRCNPILDWGYHDVWNFLRQFDIPFCSLYTEGYTSLGTTQDTKRNPALWDEANSRWSPAWELSDGSMERAGRINKTYTK